MNKIHLLLLLPAISLVACSNHPSKPPALIEHFATTIKPDGSKFFSYSLSLAQEGQKGARHMGGGHRGGGMGGGMEGGMGGHHHHGGSMDDSTHNDGRAQREAQLLNDTKEKLAARLSDNGYCRDGFITLDNNIHRGGVSIEGECNDSATTEDRKKFPNPEINKVIEERLD